MNFSTSAFFKHVRASIFTRITRYSISYFLNMSTDGSSTATALFYSSKSTKSLLLFKATIYWSNHNNGDIRDGPTVWLASFGNNCIVCICLKHVTQMKKDMYKEQIRNTYIKPETKHKISSLDTWTHDLYFKKQKFK